MREEQGLIYAIFYCVYSLSYVHATVTDPRTWFTGVLVNLRFIKVKKCKFCEYFHSEGPISDYFA